MQKRNPIAVILFTLLTFGIYGIYWFVKTKGELNQRGANIPTAWLIIIPFVNIWWMWKYSEGVEKVTNEKLSGVLTFVLLLVLDLIGMAVVQDAFNKVEAGSEAAAPVQPASSTTPETPPAPPAAPQAPTAPTTV